MKSTDKLYMILSMAIFGTIGLFTRHIAITSGELALCRAMLAAGFLLIYLAATRQKLSSRAGKGELLRLLLSGVAMGFNWILLFEAYKHTTISIATLSYYFAPVIVTVLSPLLFKERMTKKQIVCFLMSTLGLLLIIGVGDASGASLTGIAYGLGAAALYAAVILLNKSIRSVTGLHRTIWQFLAAIATLLPYVLASGGFHLHLLDGAGWACLLVMGLVHTGLAYCMYFSALRSLSGQQASILSYIDPLVAVLISVLVLGETMTLWQGVGGAMILGFTLLNETA